VKDIFSKMSFIKTKFRSTMLQFYLLAIGIEQKFGYIIDIDDIIETFKILKPVDRRMEL